MQDWSQLYAARTQRMTASEIRELLKLVDRPDIISFAGGIPDPALFPAEAFKTAYAQVFDGQEYLSGLQYSTSEGYLPLRQWIVEQMARIGVPCSVDNILITNGAQQALDYLGKLFLSPGDVALVGWPTYLGALQAFNAYEPTYQRLETSDNLAPVNAEDETGSGGTPKFAYLSPDFANPTGETLPLDQRIRILELAERVGTAVIEDGAYQSLRYNGEAVPPLLALDIARTGDIDATRTIYCGSFSKTLSPGLRLGWVCAARPVIGKLILEKQASDLNSATINQMVMAKVAESCFDEQVGKIRAAYKTRRDAMLAALERHMPDGVNWSRPEGGMFIWLQLPQAIDGADLLRQSLETVKVAFVPGGAFFPDGSGRNHLRLNFTSSGPDKIEEGIARLGKLMRDSLAAAA